MIPMLAVMIPMLIVNLVTNQVYSDKSLIYSLDKYDNFVELVSNTNFDFEYVDKLSPHIAENL